LEERETKGRWDPGKVGEEERLWGDVGRGCEPAIGDELRLTGGEWKGEVGAGPKDNQGRRPEIKEKTEGATAENSGIEKLTNRKETNKGKPTKLPSFVVGNAFNTEGNRDDDEGGR
jgi:hypothetical protein